MLPPTDIAAPNLAIVIVAAGSSRRYGSDKLAETIGGRTVLETAVATLRRALPGAPVVVVVPAHRRQRWRSTLESAFSGVRVIPGGSRRQDSVRLGVEHAVTLGAEIVAVHDAARPAVHHDDIRRLASALGDADGAILCTRPVDTVKNVDDSGVVIETLDRGVLRLAQTPQIFRVAALEDAWRTRGRKPEWSDESAMLETCGFEIRAIVADHPNPKLTTRSDLELIRLLAEKR